MTKEEVLEKIRFYGEIRGLSIHTINEYHTKAKMYLDHYDKPATELDVSHIQQYIHYLIQEKNWQQVR